MLVFIVILLVITIGLLIFLLIRTFTKNVITNNNSNEMVEIEKINIQQKEKIKRKNRWIY